MKALALAMLLFASGSEAQVAKPVQSGSTITPVGVAYKLYVGCVSAEFQSATITARTKGTLRTFLRELDDKCLVWTVIWYTPLQGYPLAELPTTSIQTFNALRIDVIDRAYSDVAEQYNIK